MYRQPSLDLGYTHEIPIAARREPIEAASPAHRARDLTSRLRCLKTLHDIERDRRLGPCGLAYRARAARPHSLH